MKGIFKNKKNQLNNVLYSNNRCKIPGRNKGGIIKKQTQKNKTHNEHKNTTISIYIWGEIRWFKKYKSYFLKDITRVARWRSGPVRKDIHESWFFFLKLQFGDLCLYLLVVFNFYILLWINFKMISIKVVQLDQYILNDKMSAVLLHKEW